MDIPMQHSTTVAAALLFACAASVVQADSGQLAIANGVSVPTACISLIATPDDTRYDVNFETDIRLQLQTCYNCHINNDQGQLSMSVANARINLIGDDETGALSLTQPGRLRVRPFAPGDSVLMQRINCTPQHGNPSLLLQKLVHDWIAAGALMPNSPGGNRLFIGNFESIVRPGATP